LNTLSVMRTILSLVALCLLSPMALASWQTTRFHVVLGEPLDEAHVPQIMSAPTSSQRDASSKAHSALRETYLMPGVGGISHSAQEVATFASLTEKIERFLEEIATTYQTEGYLGPPAMSYDSGMDAYRVYILDFAQSAYLGDKGGLAGRYFGTGCGTKDRAGWIALNLPQLLGESDERLFNLLAHELFHAVQDNYGQQFKSWNSCKDAQPAQIEGSAEAVSSYISNKKFSGYISRYGAADSYAYYDYPFVVAGDNGMDEAYKTASFFRYLMERFTGHKIIQGLFSNRIKDQVSPNGVLDWLDKCLAKTCGIGYSLYFVFPDFAANLALWGKDRYHNYYEENWRYEVLDECTSVNLEPLKGKDSVTTSPIYLQPTTARCIKVSVTGLKPKQRVAVKFMSMESGPNARKKLDSLHLGLSRLGGIAETFGGAFDCREAAKRTKSPVCLDKPFLGERGKRDRAAEAGETDTSSMAKMWLSDRQSSASGAFENIYVVSDTSTPPRLNEYDDSSHGKGYPLTLIVSLDHSSGSSTERGEFEDPGAGINRALNTEPAQMHGGESNAFANAGFPDMSRMPFLPDPLLSAELEEELEDMYGDGISLIHVHETNVTASEAQFKGSTNFTIGVEKPIRFGQTGTFRAAMTMGGTVMDSSSPDAMILPDNMNSPTGTVTVHRFDDSMLNLDLVVGYCRYPNMDFESGICRKPDTLRASIAKPFGWTYDPSSGFYSVMSPGQELYGKLIEGAFYGGPSNLQSDESSPFDSFIPGGSSAGSSSDGGQGGCNCSCEEFEAIQNAAERLEQSASESDGGMPDMSGINVSRMMCVSQCARQYGQCN